MFEINGTAIFSCKYSYDLVINPLINQSIDTYFVTD